MTQFDPKQIEITLAEEIILDVEEPYKQIHTDFATNRALVPKFKHELDFAIWTKLGCELVVVMQKVAQKTDRLQQIAHRKPLLLVQVNNLEVLLNQNGDNLPCLEQELKLNQQQTLLVHYIYNLYI